MKRAWHIFPRFITYTCDTELYGRCKNILVRKNITRISFKYMRNWTIFARIRFSLRKSRNAQRNLLADITYARNGYVSFFPYWMRTYIMREIWSQVGKRLNRFTSKRRHREASYVKFMRLIKFKTESHEISQMFFTPQKAVSSNSNYLKDVIWSLHVYATVIIYRMCISISRKFHLYADYLIQFHNYFSLKKKKNIE